MLLAPPGQLPRRTAWYLVSATPGGDGDVDLYPARDGGLDSTWAHQARNLPDGRGRPWMTGELCSRTSAITSTRFFDSLEPPAFPERAAWVVQGALRWLAAASLGDLTRAEERFELPDMPRAAMTVAFSEDSTQLAYWAGRTGRCGLATLTIARPGELLVTTEFAEPDGLATLSIPWGTALRAQTQQRATERAVWLALPGPPVRAPWHVPETWGELQGLVATRNGGKDILAVLHQSRTVRDAAPRVLLLGAPIPDFWGGEPVRFHWWALRLPALAPHRHAPRGFRVTSASRRRYDRAVAFAGDRPIEWLRTENWSPTALRVRGFHPELVRHRALLLGAGAMGSVMAELLVRGGLGHLTVHDGDTLAGGNLVRHTGLFAEVGQNKARSLATRLGLSAPHVRVHADGDMFGPARRQDQQALAQATLILDATGNDDVLRSLARRVGADALFVSVWLGREGRRLYVYTAYGASFPVEDWRQAWAPWRAEERDRTGSWPWEDTGCWSPTFPACGDDVWKMAAVAVQVVVAVLRKRRNGLAVYEASSDADGLPDLRRVLGPGAPAPAMEQS